MGYTHYFEQLKVPTYIEWNNITTDFRKLIASAFITKPLPIQRESDDPVAVLINDEVIAFNGIGDDGHETMCLQCNSIGFNFCKTNFKPYDAVVTALLIIVNHHAPDCYSIRSDGDQFEWQNGMDLVNEHLTTEMQFPPAV